MAIDQDFYWNDFNKEVNIKLSNAIKYLHIAFDRRNDCIYNIKDFEIRYKQVGIDLSNIDILNNRSKIYYNKKQKEALGVKLCSYINSYNYLVYEKIPLLEQEIKTLNAIRNYPRDLYRRLQLSLNHEIAKHILKGNIYSFGGTIGSIRIYIKDIPKERRLKRINWCQSFGFYNKLIKDGYTPKTKANPDGIEWHIHSISDNVAFVRFKPSRKPCINAKYYKFHLGYSHEMCPSEDKKAIKGVKALKNKTFNEILDMRGLNSMNKLSAICSNFDDLKRELYPDIQQLNKHKW